MYKKVSLINFQALVSSVTSLTGLFDYDSDISSNNISGPIPSSVGDLEHLLKLWVLFVVLNSLLVHP